LKEPTHAWSITAKRDAIRFWHSFQQSRFKLKEADLVLAKIQAQWQIRCFNVLFAFVLWRRLKGHAVAQGSAKQAQKLRLSTLMAWHHWTTWKQRGDHIVSNKTWFRRKQMMRYVMLALLSFAAHQKMCRRSVQIMVARDIELLRRDALASWCENVEERHWERRMIHIILQRSAPRLCSRCLKGFLAFVMWRRLKRRVPKTLGKRQSRSLLQKMLRPWQQQMLWRRKAWQASAAIRELHGKMLCWRAITCFSNFASWCKRKGNATRLITIRRSRASIHLVT
jgi:hypothetical protein